MRVAELTTQWLEGFRQESNSSSRLAVGSPEVAGGIEAAVGSTPKRIFGFHSAHQLIKAVHEVEGAYRLGRDDRAYRQIVTAGDQAIQGDGSVRFTRKERALDRLPPDPLSEGVCKFHVTDGVGCGVDKRYGETFVFDRMLRLIRRHFAWGTGNLILRAVASKFGDIVHIFKADEVKYLERLRQTTSRWRPSACARQPQRLLVRLPPSGGRAGTLGGSRWLQEQMARERQSTRIELELHFLIYSELCIGDCKLVCSSRSSLRVMLVCRITKP